MNSHRLSMEITPTDLQQFQYGTLSRSHTPSASGQFPSHGNSVRSRPVSIVSKASRASKRTTYSVRHLGTAPPSVIAGEDEHEAPQRRFKSARLVGE